MLQFECPSCQTRMQASEEFAGKTTLCPKCNTPTKIPASEPPPTDAITTAPAPVGAVTTPEQARPKKAAAADRDSDDDRPRRRRDASSGTGKAAAGLGVGAIIAIVVVLMGCVGIGVVAILVALLVPAVQKVREAAVRTESMNNLKQIALACHNHNDANKFLPSPKMFPAGPNGKATELSWRVSLLPYLDQDPMFRQFNQNAAWDNPANSRFLQMRPPTYDSRNKPALPMTDTHYQYFTGPNTLFPTPGQRVNLGNIPDGSSNTFLFAEARDPVPWSKPADMVVAGGPLPLPPDRFFAAMADASVRTFDRSKVSEQTLRLAINPQDGQPLPGDFFR